MPVIKELSKNHICTLYIGINKPLEVKHFAHQGGNVYINEKIYKMLEPLLKSQEYLHKVEEYKNQEVDIDFDILRKLPINLLFDNLRYGFLITGIQPDIDIPYISVDPHNEIKKKIVILRSQRYKNHFISYKFLENYDDILDSEIIVIV